MEIRITAFLYKLFMIPFLYLMLYLLALYYGMNIIDYFEVKNNILENFAIGIFIASVIVFAITFLIYIITKKIWNTSVFKKWFHFTHVTYGYISGLISVIVSIEPVLIKNQIITMPINDNYKIMALLFFIIISNYTFFNSFILNNDLQNERINRINNPL